MQAAFFLGRFFPPPATFALVLVGQYWTGTRLTTNADEAFFVQRIEGNLVSPEVQPHFLRTPVGQGVVLNQLPIGRAKAIVDLHHGDIGAGGALVFALAGDPGIDGAEFAAEGLDFADTAAFFVVVFVEAVEAFFAHEFFDGGGIGIHHFDLDAVVFADGVEVLVGFGMEAARVEAEDLDILLEFDGHIDQDDILGPTEGDRNVVKLLQGLCEDFLGGLAGEFGIECGDRLGGHWASELRHGFSLGIRKIFGCSNFL
jgi:hypothetical protein